MSQLAKSVMKYILMFVSIGIICGVSSCGSDNQTDEPKSTYTPVNTLPASNVDKENIQEVSSFDFIDKYSSDNFFKTDIDGKEIKITDLLVDGYQIDNNGNAKLYCLAFSPEKSLIYLSHSYLQKFGQYRSKSRLNENESHFLLGDKELSFIVDSMQLTSDGNSHWEYSADCEHFFLVVLNNAKEIKGLTSYNGSVQDFNICKSYYSPQPYYKFSDLINVTGVFHIKSEVESSVEHCCPKYIFEDCTFTRNSN
jgi:hypothetical protein